MVVDPGFAVDAPPEAAWELERNRRWNGEPLVVFSHRGRSAGALSFRMLRVTDDSFGVPLEVLAEGYFFTSGAIDGVKANLTSTSHILVGEQPAVAVVEVARAALARPATPRRSSSSSRPSASSSRSAPPTRWSRSSRWR